MNLPEKKNLFKPAKFIFYSLLTLLFLTAFCIQVSPALGLMNGATLEGELERNVFITEFYSDHNFSDATIWFEKPLENVSLVFTLSSGNQLLKSETFILAPVKKGQEITKILLWGLAEDYGEDRKSYTAQLFVKNGSETIDSRKVSFSYRNPTLSKLKVVDFSADSEKASALLTPTSNTGFGSVQLPEPSMIDFDLKLLSGADILYSDKQENIPIINTYYNVTYWPLLLENDKNYTALLKVHSHSPDISTAYRSDFRAEEKVEIIDRDIDVDEYGASVTVIGKSQVPYDGIIRVVLSPAGGKAQVFEETADILTAGKEDTVGIIWQGVPKGDYNVKIYVLNREGKILDSHETVLRVFEPVVQAEPIEKSSMLSFFAILGIFLCAGVLSGRIRQDKKGP